MIKKIEVLGSGCVKCRKTADLIEQGLEAAGIGVELVKVEAIEEIVQKGIMMTPAVLIDGQTKCAGRVPSAGEIKSWFE